MLEVTFSQLALNTGTNKLWQLFLRRKTSKYIDIEIGNELTDTAGEWLHLESTYSSIRLESDLSQNDRTYSCKY